MSKTDQPTVQELNEIHREWMALDSDAPEKEKQRVFKLMERVPRRHLSVGVDKTDGIVMIDGGPMQARGIPIQDAKEYCRKVNGRTDIGWCGKLGMWVDL